MFLLTVLINSFISASLKEAEKLSAYPTIGKIAEKTTNLNKNQIKSQSILILFRHIKASLHW